MSEMVDLQFFAIVGVGRSGTTLLMSMLNAHPDIAMPPEVHFVIRYIVKKPFAELSQVIKMISNDPKFARLGLSLDEVMLPFFENNEAFSVARLYERILQVYSLKRGVHIIGDKAPKNIEYLPVLHKIFPDARVIHLIRDPRDVYLSRKKADWSKSRNDIFQFLAYRAQYGLGRRFGPQLFGENYLEVHYEKLISKTHIELNRICRLLGIAYDERMLNFSASARELVFEDEIAWKKEALGPLLKENMNKWRRELSPGKVNLIEAACLPTFYDGFYKRSNKTIGLHGVLKDTAINRCMEALTTIYQSIVRFKNYRAIHSI